MLGCRLVVGISVLALLACAAEPDVRFVVRPVGGATSGELRIGSSVETVRVGAVPAGVLSGIEHPMWLGRAFIEQDHSPSARGTIILTHPLWTELGEEPDLVGREVELDGERRIVLGVLAPGAELEPLVDVLTPEGARR